MNIESHIISNCDQLLGFENTYKSTSLKQGTLAKLQKVGNMLIPIVSPEDTLSAFGLTEIILKQSQNLFCLFSNQIAVMQHRWLSFIMAGDNSRDEAGHDSEEITTTSAVSSEQAITRSKTINILVVEDEGIVALHIKIALKNLGHQVVATADSGRDAIILAREQQPDLILMDIRLKGEMDGIEAVQEIRRQQAVPVIYLTGQLDETTVRRAQATNPVGYLAKPFTPSELSSLIEHATNKNEAV